MDDKIIEYIIIFPLVSWRKGVCLRLYGKRRAINSSKIFSNKAWCTSLPEHIANACMSYLYSTQGPNAYCIDNTRMNISIHIHDISQCDKYGARAHFPSRRFSFFLYIILESGNVHCISRSRNIAFDGLDFITGKISLKP